MTNATIFIITTINRAIVGHGVHSHDGGHTWHSHKG
jgi:hypothetical protein